MKTLTITEGQMTFLLKEFLKQYQGKFDHVAFDEASGGYTVHFHREPIRNSFGEVHSSDSASGYEPPISILTAIGLGDFGGFGGGSSGGAGATGEW